MRTTPVDQLERLQARATEIRRENGVVAEH